MIIYNFPYRGPLEYEKFVLNYMQLNNEVQYLKQTTNNSIINKYTNQINNLFNRYLFDKSIDLYNIFL